MYTSFFTRVRNEIDRTSDQILKVIEEGTSILFASNTNLLPRNYEHHQRSPFFQHGTNEEEEDFLADSNPILESSPLHGFTESIFKDLMKGQQLGPQTLWEHIQAFQAAIHWREPLILALLSFHLIILLISIYVTKHGGTAARISLLSIIAILVRSAEWINRYGSNHWERFATQNYFDSGGIFATVFFSLPLFMISFAMLILSLQEATRLIIELKKKKILERKGMNSQRLNPSASMGNQKKSHSSAKIDAAGKRRQKEYKQQ